MFVDVVEIVAQRLVGEQHLKLSVRHAGALRDAIWFGRTEPLARRVRLAYRLSIDEYRAASGCRWWSRRPSRRSGPGTALGARRNGGRGGHGGHGGHGGQAATRQRGGHGGHGGAGGRARVRDGRTARRRRRAAGRGAIRQAAGLCGPARPVRCRLPSAAGRCAAGPVLDPDRRMIAAASPLRLPPMKPPAVLESALRAATALALALALACGPAARAQATGVRAETLARGLQHPWAIAFLPGFEEHGRVLVTERRGTLRLVALPRQAGMRAAIGRPIRGVPKVAAGGQGGLLDVALDPGFAANRLVWLSYSEPASAAGGGSRGNGTAVARGRLDENLAQLSDVQVVFRQQPGHAGSAHFGGRLAFAPDGRLYVTLGERFDLRDQAQALDNHLGKTVRIERDGGAPPDNPYVATPGARPELWSIGHRNAQGAAIHPATGELWTHEHGPQGGDEVNVDLPGRNYGWPVVSHGREYGSGARIGEGTGRAGVEPPLWVWTPSIAPSGMAFLTSDRYPGWKGSLFVGALRGESLRRLTLDGRKVVGEERLLTTLFSRIRDVRQGPDGWLYLLTDNEDGRVLRVVPR